MSRVGFLRSGLTLRPEVKEELMRVVRNGKMSLETAWRRDGVKGASSGMVRRNITLDGGGRGWGGGGEERREHGKQFPRVEAEELILVR